MPSNCNIHTATHDTHDTKREWVLFGVVQFKSCRRKTRTSTSCLLHALRAFVSLKHPPTQHCKSRQERGVIQVGTRCFSLVFFQAHESKIKNDNVGTVGLHVMKGYSGPSPVRKLRGSIDHANFAASRNSKNRTDWSPNFERWNSTGRYMLREQHGKCQMKNVRALPHARARPGRGRAACRHDPHRSGPRRTAKTGVNRPGKP